MRCEKNKIRKVKGRESGETARLGETVASTSFRRGATLVGAQNRSRTKELERIAARKKALKRRVVLWLGVILVILLLGIWLVRGILAMKNAKGLVESDAEVASLTPTVQILDENAGGNVSVRVREFVARLERDLNEYGFAVERAVLPFQKTREVDIYIEGRNEYYKMNIDRSSAVQAEDMARVQRYLDERGLVVSYVDIRVEGKAFYK